MLFNNRYPYTDFHELNLDWILSKIREIDSTVTEFTALNKLTWRGTWDISQSYPAWSLVEDGNGNGYVSIKPVPAGTELTNADYWQKVADYSSLYAAFEQRIEHLEDGEAETQTAINKEAAARKSADAALETKITAAETAAENAVKNVEKSIKQLPTNIGINIVKQFSISEKDSALADYSPQGMTFDTKRSKIYVGFQNDTTVGKIAVFNSSFEYEKTVDVSGGYKMNDLDYRADTDEIWIAPNAGNYVLVYDAKNFTQKKQVTVSSFAHWIINLTHDDNYNMFFGVYNSGTDVPLYKCDKNGANPVQVGNLYDASLSVFNNYADYSADAALYYTGIQFVNGYIYIVEQSANYDVRWLPCRMLAFNAENGACKCATDYLVAKYDEPEGVAYFGNNLYIVSGQNDWTDGKGLNLAFRCAKEADSAGTISPKNTRITWTASHTNDATQEYRLNHIPSGKFLIIVKSYTPEYESGRTLFANLKLPSGEIKQRIDVTQYLNPTFNVVGYYNATDPWTLALDVNAFTQTDFTMTYSIDIIELTGVVPYSETVG